MYLGAPMRFACSMKLIPRVSVDAPGDELKCDDDLLGTGIHKIEIARVFFHYDLKNRVREQVVDGLRHLGVKAVGFPPRSVGSRGQWFFVPGVELEACTALTAVLPPEGFTLCFTFLPHKSSLGATLSPEPMLFTHRLAPLFDAAHEVRVLVLR